MRASFRVSRSGVVGLALVLLLVGAAPAWASSGHLTTVPAGIVGSIFSSIGHAVFGAFSWTVGLASKFLLTTLAALVKLLIPHSWAHQGVSIIQWIVAIPDYAGKATAPGGGQSYGFAGINALRDLFMWLGVAVAPLTLVYATSRAMVGDGDPVAIPVLRMLAVAAVIASYPYWWSQASAIADQVSNAILTVPDVSRGLNQLMQYAVGGVALGGWQLIDLGLMGAIGLALLGLIFLKVVLILLGALLYATGPLTIGLVPTRGGATLARAWGSAVLTLFGLGVAWSAIFAVGAVLIGDASTAAPLIAGTSSFGSVVGGMLLAVAGLASLWLCLRAGREAGGLLRLQLGGLLGGALHHGAPSTSAARPGRVRASGGSMRAYGSRLTGAAGAGSERLAGAGTAGAALAGVTQSAAHLARRGLLGTAWDGARRRAASPTGTAAPLLARSRAGVVAARAARGTVGTTPGAPSRHRRHNAEPRRGRPAQPRTQSHGDPSSTSSSPGTPAAAPRPRSTPASDVNPASPRPEPRPSQSTDGGAPAREARTAVPEPAPSEIPNPPQSAPRATSTHGSPVRTPRGGTQRRWSGPARPLSPADATQPAPPRNERPAEEDQ
jgi:hypothetical protein